MNDSLEQKAEALINGNITNIELISYFKKSTAKTPVFLSVIQRNYAEIRPLLNNKLVIDLEAVKSYELHIDKLENYFYSKYQEKIDELKDEIWNRKRKKIELVEITENLEPEAGSADYDQKLQQCLLFAQKAVEDLDIMEIEKEECNFEVGDLQEQMKEDPLYKFLLYVRNDSNIEYNKRTEDNDSKIRSKILSYLEKSKEGKGKELFKELWNKGFFKEYSPAKNYYISDLGLCVDGKLKEVKWNEEIADSEKTKEELAQDEEFNKLSEQFDL